MTGPLTQPLTTQQLNALKDALNELRQGLEALLADTEKGTKPVMLKENQGRLSRMDELHNQSILVANRNVTTNRLRQVIAAQYRLEQGVYGECVECGEYIQLSRLNAYPEANMCIECQEDKEALL